MWLHLRLCLRMLSYHNPSPVSVGKIISRNLPNTDVHRFHTSREQRTENTRRPGGEPFVGEGQTLLTSGWRMPCRGGASAARYYERPRREAANRLSYLGPYAKKPKQSRVSQRVGVVDRMRSEKVALRLLFVTLATLRVEQERKHLVHTHAHIHTHNHTHTSP